MNLWRHIAAGLFSGFLFVSSAQAVSMTFAWDYTQGTEPAVGFNFYRAPTCTGTFLKLNTPGLIPVTQLTYTDDSATLAIGQTHCWKVTAVDADGMEASGTTSSKLFRVKGILNPTENLRNTNTLP